MFMGCFMNTLFLNGTEYAIIKLLGKGKGGYSYLVKKDGKEFVLKQIHHEPCAYYEFGNKLQSELRDYQTLSELDIPMPKLLAVDKEEERILKEYIPGPTVYDLVLQDRLPDRCIEQVLAMCRILYPAGLNIDYFPTNFVVCGDEMYYIDFECNSYMEQWNFENWGIKYWSKTPEFQQYTQEHNKKA